LKFFPIKTETACKQKWSFSKIMLHLNKTASCHRVIDTPFDMETFNFHNTPEKIQQRETMLRGEWPDGDPNPMETTCNQYCGEFERNGGRSDRQFQNSVPGAYPEALDEDATLTSVDCTQLEVYPGNTCNLKCIYCTPLLSSPMEAELKKFGRFEKNGLVLENYYDRPTDLDSRLERYWQWMEDHAGKLERLHLLGGEPFYDNQFDRYLDLFDRKPNQNLEFEIVTNLMISMDRLKDYCDKLKKLIIKRKIKRVELLCSMDCWGPQQELVRSGLDLKQWEENFKYLISQKWIKLSINGTVSVLTIKTMPALLGKLKEWTVDRKIEHYFNMAYMPTYMDPRILGSDEFEQSFDEIMFLMEDGTHSKEHFQGIINNVKSGRLNKQEVLKLLTYLDELDNRRGTDWKTLFPWLEEYRNVVQ